MVRTQPGKTITSKSEKILRSKMGWKQWPLYLGRFVCLEICDKTSGVRSKPKLYGLRFGCSLWRCEQSHALNSMMIKQQ